VWLVEQISRTPAGKADYRWARRYAEEQLAVTQEHAATASAQATVAQTTDAQTTVAQTTGADTTNAAPGAEVTDAEAGVPGN